MQVIIHSDDGVTSPEVQRAVDAALAEVRDVAAAKSPYGPRPAPGLRRRPDRDRDRAVHDRAKDIPEGAVEQAQASFDPLRDLGVQVGYGDPQCRPR